MIAVKRKDVENEFWKIARDVIPKNEWFRFVLCEIADGIGKSKFPKEYSEILARLNKKFAAINRKEEMGNLKV